jgi:hypothetical protein
MVRPCDREKAVKKSVYALLAVPVAGIATALAVAIPADAATANLQFTLIQYDSPSHPDTSRTSSVNGEVVRIYNNSTFTTNLGRYTLRDAQGHVYTFPSHQIGPKRTVYIHTGKGKDGFKPDGKTRDSTRRYMNRGFHIWNNTGDTATLRSATGRTYDSCRWTSRGSGKTSCGPVGRTAVGTTPTRPATVRPSTSEPPKGMPSESVRPRTPQPPKGPPEEHVGGPPPVLNPHEPDPDDQGSEGGGARPIPAPPV